MRFREVTQLPVTDPPHLAAMGYLATIAYPDTHDKRDQLIEAFKARHDNVRELMNRERPRSIDERDIRRTLRKAQNIIWFERFPALWAACEISLSRSTEGQPLRICAEDRVTKAARNWSAYSQQSESKFYERAWQPSLAVLHLVLPFRNYVQFELQDKRLPLPHFVWDDPFWVNDALQVAERSRQWFIDHDIVKLPEHPRRPISQIRLLPA